MAPASTQPPWWRGAVIYQIYPRSFRDTSGDGVGDLPGILEKLPYVASLGVDAVWISPFLKSPMRDFGYDVSDYRAVDPLFGTLDDFDRVIAEAHRLGLRIFMDHVLSHTSDEHPWFLESRASRDNPRADWYVWADPRPDGTPPNNWLSVFGGGAWQWEPRRGQYYLHNFLVSQPDLNHHNPEVRRAMLEELAFWFDRGVDGVRLDAVNFCYHDALLRDNPPRLSALPPTDSHLANPYSRQIHLFDKSRPEMLGLLAELRALADRYGAVLLGEIGADDALDLAAEYAGPGRLHLTYTFDLLNDRFGADRIREVMERLERGIGEGSPCWSFSNHDVTRVVTRWGGASAGEPFAILLLALLLSLRGALCVYQGEELGLPEAEVPFERLRDPYGIAFWPEYRGRDGSRTPMPWIEAAPHAGFSEVEPWLPVPEAHRALAVDAAEARPGSALHAFRRLVAFRRAHPALRVGSIRFLDDTHVPPGLLVFERAAEGERILAAFNLGAGPARLDLAAWPALSPLEDHGLTTARIVGRELELDAHGVFFGRIG